MGVANVSMVYTVLSRSLCFSETKSSFRKIGKIEEYERRVWWVFLKVRVCTHRDVVRRRLKSRFARRRARNVSVRKRVYRLGIWNMLRGSRNNRGDYAISPLRINENPLG